MPHLPCTINSVRSLHQIFIKSDNHSNENMCATKESVTEIPQACASGHLKYAGAMTQGCLLTLLRSS